MSPYSTRNFFLRAPHNLLADYFDARSIEFKVDLTGRIRSDVEKLHEAWLLLEDKERQQAETDFRDIQELATDLGIANVRSLAELDGKDIVATLGAMDDDYDRSFWVFLRHPELFDDALRLLDADRLPGRSWRKRKDLPRREPGVDEPTVELLKEALIAYFRRAEGRGHHCDVHTSRRAGKRYYFVLAEDHSRAEPDFDGGSLQRRSHRPAFEVVFLYDPAAGSLDTYAQGGMTTIHELQAIFASVALGQKLEPAAKDDRVYNLEPLAKPSFRFTYDPGTRIFSVEIRKLRLSLIRSRGHRVIIEAPAQAELYERYQRVVAAFGATEKTGITQAEIHVTYAEDSGRRPRSKTFSVTYPNGCSLGQDDADGALREMLIASGLDPSGLGRDARRR